MPAIRHYEIIQRVRTVVRSTSPENAVDVLSRVQTIANEPGSPQSYDVIDQSRVVEIDVSEHI